LHFGVLTALLYAVLTTVHLNMRFAWVKTPGKSFMLFSLFASTMIPLMIIGLTIATSGYAYGVGNVCLVEHEKSAVTFYGWVIGLGVLAFFIMAWTGAYTALAHFRDVKRTVRGSLTLDGGPLVRQSAVGKVTVREELQNVIMGVLLPIESLVAMSILWVTDQKLLHAKDYSKMRDFVGCLVANQGQVHLCRDSARGILPRQSLVLFAFILMTVSFLRQKRYLCCMLITIHSSSGFKSHYFTLSDHL
jgi:hypothetical protein